MTWVTNVGIEIDKLAVKAQEWVTLTFGEEGTVPLAFSTFWTSISTGFSTWVADIGTKLDELATKATEWVTLTFGEEGTVPTSLNTFVTTTIENFRLWVEDVSGKFDALKETLTTWVTTVFGPEGTLIKGIKELNQPLKDWWDRTFGTDGEFHTWFKSFFGPGGVISKIIESFVTFGKDIWKGLIKGLEDGWDWAKGRVQALMERLIAEAKAKLLINSPSLVFMEMGKSIGEGLAMGIDKISGEPVDAVSELLDRMQAYGSVRGGNNFVSHQTSVTNVRNVNVSMNPTYANVQSPASIYNDVTAALATVSA